MQHESLFLILEMRRTGHWMCKQAVNHCGVPADTYAHLRLADSARDRRRDEWLAERKRLLAREKELTRLRDRIAGERRRLPWVLVDKDYVFDTPEGKRRVKGNFLPENGIRIKPVKHKPRPYEIEMRLGVIHNAGTARS